MLLATFESNLAPGDLWVFGYGSLMWSPRFSHTDRLPARLCGYHRTLCIYSHRFRGSRQQPGLVLGLRAGGSCTGTAFLVRENRRRTVLRALWEREMRGGVYRPTLGVVKLPDERTVHALCFVAKSGYPQYAGRLPVDAMALHVARGHGEGGSNIAYIENTLAHLRELRVRDRVLEAVLAAARRIR